MNPKSLILLAGGGVLAYFVYQAISKSDLIDSSSPATVRDLEAMARCGRGQVPVYGTTGKLINCATPQVIDPLTGEKREWRGTEGMPSNVGSPWVMISPAYWLGRQAIKVYDWWPW